MAKSEYVNVFDLEGAYAGGGDFFTPGRYRVDEGGSYFTMFDFYGKADEPAPALCLELFPLDDAGKPTTKEPSPQFWPVRGDGVELANPIRGQKGAFASITLTGKFDTLMKGGEFHMFMDFLRKAGFDFDSFDNDITVFGGALDAMFNLTPDPYDVERRKNATPAEPKKGEKPKKDYGPRKIIVVTEICDGKKSGGKAADKGKKDDDADAGKGSKTAGKSKKAEDMKPLEILEKYVDEVMNSAKTKEAITRPLLRLEAGKYIKSDLELGADVVKDVQDLINDDDELKAVLTKFGWKLKGREILPPEE